MKNISQKSLLSALCLHVIVLLGAGLYLTLMPFVEPRLGKQAARSVASYLYQENLSAATEAVTEKEVPPRRSAPSSPFLMAKKESSLRQEKPEPQQHQISVNNALELSAQVNSASSSQKSNIGEEVKILLGLLHVAIERQQQYPPSALRMGRQGRARVGFRLYPDGTMQGLKLIKSSGTDSLDAAALGAVERVIPFRQAATYLRSFEDFHVDVVFALDAEAE